VASIGATSAMSASRRPQAVAASAGYARVVADTDAAETMPASRPVSAYAPVRSGFAADPISGGRGLY
jgi:hypothetical protein